MTRAQVEELKAGELKTREVKAEETRNSDTSPTISSSNTKPEIKFQGRKAQRADSRERRRIILEATLRIIIRTGIRGVKHRAVAKEADVPLAATTYYFKDISELITDAFNLYAEDCIEGTRQLEESSFAALGSFTAEQLQSKAVRDLLSEAIAQFIVDHILAQVAERDMRILEHAFRNEALRNKQLAATAELPQQQMNQTIINFFTQLGSSDPEADAHIIMGAILHLEYLCLMKDSDPDREMLQRTVSRLVRQTVTL